jgi:RNA polymerase sigma factor (sigma-70 family)
MSQRMDADVVEWVTTNFLPFEAELRVMLRRVCSGPAEIDDVVQEVYYKVLVLPSLDHVREPRAFLVRMAKNIVTDRLRRDAIVRIDAMANIDELDIEDGAPSPERIAMARAELKWVIGLIARLPDRCRDVFRARRIHGMSQRETAQSLNITEGIVEQETMKGMELISDMIARIGAQDDAPVGARKTKRPGKTAHVKH